MDTFVDATSACDLIGRYPELAGSTAVIDRRLAGREFVIEAAAVGYSFRAGATAALVAAVDYLLARLKRRQVPELPIHRVSPFPNRLIMEDFAFDCYQPTGFDFSLDDYARNLAALGYTGMECNRFSHSQPMAPYHWNYAFTNPSLAWFFETPLHGGAIPRELIEANHRELAATIGAAVKYGLEPIITTFLPRPYPESFFAVHPQWRGPRYESGYFRKSGLAPVYSLDTDNPEVQEFYRQIYAQLFDEFPQIRHMFFWHSDLGTAFWGDGQGPKKLRMVDRVAGFHRMLRREIDQRHLDVKVWLNPWGLAKESLDLLAETMPEGISFSIKDNPGLESFAGSRRYVLPDATIIHGELGEIPRKIFRLAEETGRRVCLGQYQDFSEDLDPVIGAPHPMMTFRKFLQLRELDCEYSATHWGVISPDLLPVNLNREVIREMSWGDPAEGFNELFPKLVPAVFETRQRQKILDALGNFDRAFALWPQLWGLRLQDMGLRLRWLMRPFKVGGEYSDAEQEFLAAHQIYHICPHDPYDSFLQMTPDHALELAGYYDEMIALFERAIAELESIEPADASAREFLASLIEPGRLIRLFWITFRNLLAFYGTRDGKCVIDGECRTAELRRIVDEEIANTRETIDYLRDHQRHLVIASRGEWGQCFGPNLLEVFGRKLELMERDRN